MAVTELHVRDPKAKNKQRVVQDLTKTTVALENAAKLLLKKEDMMICMQIKCTRRINETITS